MAQDDTIIKYNSRDEASPRPSDDNYGLAEPKAGRDNSVESGDASPVQRGEMVAIFGTVATAH
jgi:hypothetical protein